MSTVSQLINAGYVEECAECGGFSSYEWEDANQQEGIMHMPSYDFISWQCGHCLALHDREEMADVG